ncbi:MAG TPA: flavodoxin-dependent (E)-4-hydroxy-3-methylbut-2-enyl-diphosphate synthase, partial [Bacteroidales bacterium]|nr:flavodoxin-dependent (E)-4-hydroxy-3-methylbut-2-enyl-diphosphate synthase [Bacteroidales bacterium]
KLTQVFINIISNALEVIPDDGGVIMINGEVYEKYLFFRIRDNGPGISKEVKERFSKYPGLTLAVMGCIVNGPGEMKEAQAGIVGNGLNKANIYIYGKLVSKNIPINDVVDEFEKQLKIYNLI